MRDGVGVVGSTISSSSSFTLSVKAGVSSFEVVVSSLTSIPVVVGSILSVASSVVSVVSLVTPSTTYGSVVVSTSSACSVVVVSSSTDVVSLVVVVVSLDMEEYCSLFLLGATFSINGATVGLISCTCLEDDEGLINEFLGNPLTGTPEDLMFEYISVLVEMEVVPPTCNVVK